MPYTFPGAVLRAHDWRARALCAGADPEIFFPTNEPTNRYDARNAQALAMCAVCPVLEQCRDWALDSGQAYGIAGGLTAGERRRVLARRGDVRAALEAQADAAGEGADSAPREDAPGRNPVLSGKRGVQTRARGIAMLIEGVTITEITLQLDVNRRTVERWAARPDVKARRPVPRPTGGISRREAARMGARAVS
jgi:WhiB family transcriptional regulator, redox-sensing transcriptional regulator